MGGRRGKGSGEVESKLKVSYVKIMLLGITLKFSVSTTILMSV